MTGLYKNELLKLIAQTSFKVILILALLLSLLTPVAILGLEGLFDSVGGEWDEMEFYEDMYETAEDPVEKAYYGAMLESDRWFSENDIGEDDWRYIEYCSEYENLNQLIAAYRLLEEGIPYEKVTSYFYLDDGYESAYSETPFSIPGRWIPAKDDEGEWLEPGVDSPNFFPDDAEIIENEDFTPPTPQEAGKYRALLEGERAVLQKKLEVVTVAEHFEDLAKGCLSRKEADEKTLEALRAALSAAKKDAEREQIEYNIETVSLDAKCAGEMAESYSECAKRGYGYTDWHVSAGTSLRETVYLRLSSSTILGRAAYDDRSQSYDDYLAKQTAARKDAERALALLEYSLQNDIPVDDGDDARLGGAERMRTAMGVSVSLTTLVLIIAAGTSVAREHTDGTVRLLLIRPKTRGKILLSKYLALLTYGFGILLLSFLVQAVIFTLRSPMEMLGGSAIYLFGGILTMPMLLRFFLQMLLLFAGAWVLMAMALFFSVVTKRTALSILFPILVNAAGGTVSTVTCLLLQAFPRWSFLRYTLLPYLDMEPFLYTPLERASSQGDSFLFGNLRDMATGMCFPVGFVQILLVGVLFTFFAFYAFRRQQIKS